MDTPMTGDSISAILHDFNLAWLLPNVRQDFIIWNSLQDTKFLETLVNAKPAGSTYSPADFSPANLALIALDQPSIANQEPDTLLNSVESQVIQMAIRSFNDKAVMEADSWDLQDAGLIALALAYNFQITNSWTGLLTTLPVLASKNWLTAITCLYGLIEQPAGLLNALVQPDCVNGRVRLAIHAVLSNPIPPDEQIAKLTELCYGPHGDLLPAADRVRLVRELSEQRPQLAQDFCSHWLEKQPDISKLTKQHPLTRTGKLGLLNEISFYGEIYKNTGQANRLAKLLSLENQLIQGVSAELLCQTIIRRPNGAQEGNQVPGSSTDDQETTQIFKLITSAEQHAVVSAKLALNLSEQGRVNEARDIFSFQDDPLPDDVDILYAIAKIAYMNKDLPRAEAAALHIMEKLNQDADFNEISIWGEYLSLINLGNLLLNLHHPSEAIHVLEHALSVCPNDAELLSMLATSYQSANKPQQAASTFQALASLFPANTGYRRSFAQALETLGDWEASLNERTIIIGAYPQDGASFPNEDVYAYVNCALKANYPEQAVKTCDDLLSRDAEDYQALVYAGQAQLLLEDNNQAIELFLKATQISPNRAEAWLALASAQKRIYPSQVVIETLKNASQSVPDSAHLHFALGDLYMQDNTPTLALPELQSAVDISPDDPAILVSYGKALNGLGHAADARNAFAKAYDQDANFPELARLYSQVLTDSGAIEEAISPLEVLIDSKSIQDISIYLEYARCLLELNKRGSRTHPPMKALIALNEVLQVDPEHAEAKALSAEALALSGEHELAFQAYREALDSNLTEQKDWFERLSFGFGCVANAIGKYDVAIAALQEASQANPGNPEIFQALSDVYLAASLPEDAMRSARNVLVIDGENPDKLAWFATQAKKVIQNSLPDLSNASNNFVKEVSGEALNALHQAIQLAPTLASLLLQLGDLHIVLGEQEQAKTIFSSMASFEFASVAELKGASAYLIQLAEHDSAIACLVKGISIDQVSSSEHDPSLYACLAKAYLSNHDHASAITVLDQAIELISDENSLVYLKVDTLLGLGQLQEALSCIESSLQQAHASKPDLQLIFLAAQISRSMGDLSAALRYAGMGSQNISTDNQPDDGKLATQYRTQVAELYRVLLQPEQAYRIINVETATFPAYDPADLQQLELLCLKAELALDIGEQPCNEILEANVNSSHPHYSRLMAIKVRSLNKAGDYIHAVQLCRPLLEKVGKWPQDIETAHWLVPYHHYLECVSLVEACLDLGLWDQAQALNQQLIELAPQEPLPYLCAARLIVSQAEFDKLCGILEVTKHRPVDNLLSLENYQLCRQYLDKTSQLVKSYRDENILEQNVLSSSQIYRWQARLNIAYDQKDEQAPDQCDILSRQPVAEDTASLISHLRQLSLLDPDSGSLNRIIKLARAYPHNPAVILQVALALQDRDAHDAMKSLQSVLEANPSSSGPIIAFSNLLLARLAFNLDESAVARGAIDAAISFWQDEPGWHALAAKVYQHDADLNTAINHLIVATQLAPKVFTYHLDLGGLYLQHAGDDPHMLSRALVAFEQAQALEGDNVPALISLASTQYRLNDLKNAERNAHHALLIAPNQADIYQLLSKIAIASQDFQGAYEYANKAFLINPKDIQSSVTLAKALSALGQHEEALAKLDTVISKNQDAYWLQLERVSLICKKDGPQAALTELLSLVNLYPHDFNILNALSRSYLEVGELENAVSLAQQALHNCPDEASPNDRANLHLMIGKVLRQTGQLDRSIRHLDQAIQLAPDRLEPYLELGGACKERREYQQALKIFEQASIIAPEDPRALFEAGLAFKESKDYKSSETMLRRAVSLAPNDLNIRRQLAAVVALNLVHNPRAARNYAQ
jgi:tetratricopeptide (TPR) repeat protein